MYCKIKNDDIKRKWSSSGRVFRNPDKVKVLAIVKGHEFSTHLLEANWNSCVAPKRVGQVVYEVPGLVVDEFGDFKGGFWVHIDDIEIVGAFTNREAIGMASLDSSY